MRWGLSADADLLYRTLVAFGPRTTSRAARELGLAARRVRTAFDELAAVSAARPAPRIRSSGARLAEPEWVPTPVERVLTTIRRHQRPPGTAADRWRNQLAAIDGIDSFSVDSVPVRHHATRALARARIGQLVAATTREQLSLNTEEVLTAEAVAAARPLDAAMRGRGLRLRSMGLPIDDRDARYAGLGDEFRELDAVPLKLMIYDRQVALFPADPLNFEAGLIEVRDPALVEQFCGLFNRLWTAGRDPRRAGVAPVQLTTRETRIVTLLADGQSESSVAAELDLSRRTVNYALRDLMDRLGVENRFQLGLRLGAAKAALLPRRNKNGET
jgi:DNA-binding CsgD family transcriptional regulator